MSADQTAHEGPWLLPTWQGRPRLGTTQTLLERAVLHSVHPGEQGQLLPSSGRRKEKSRCCWWGRKRQEEVGAEKVEDIQEKLSYEDKVGLLRQSFYPGYNTLLKCFLAEICFEYFWLDFINSVCI